MRWGQQTRCILFDLQKPPTLYSTEAVRPALGPMAEKPSKEEMTQLQPGRTTAQFGLTRAVESVTLLACLSEIPGAYQQRSGWSWRLTSAVPRAAQVRGEGYLSSELSLEPKCPLIPPRTGVSRSNLLENPHRKPQVQISVSWHPFLL